MLNWLPHKRQLLWDDLWQHNGVVDGVLGCERVRTMRPGHVHVRLDFIKNAELRSPNQAQREYFISLGLSLLCVVVQWRVDGELRSRTFMYLSEDRKHDGSFAEWAMAHLVQHIIPSLPGLGIWTTLTYFSDNGPHFAQTYKKCSCVTCPCREHL